MQDLKFSTQAKREKFLSSIAYHQAKLLEKELAKADFYAPLPDENGAAQVVTTPAVPGQVAGHPHRPSNLDLTGSRLVKRGVSVSWGGMRGTVLMARLGYCVIRFITSSRSELKWPDMRISCSSVQVLS